MRRAGLLPAAVFATAVLLGACATNPVTGRPDLVLMSEGQELALGQQAHQQTLQQYAVYDDPALQQYVDAVGQRLAAVSHRPELSYTFTVLDSTEINAFALPGGYIYMTRGLLAYMNSEAELAAVLGHEIGHVTARHGVRQASSAQATSLGAGVLSVLFPTLRQTGLDQAVGMLGTALLRGYGREHELEADRLGAEYLAATGYDPQAMFDVIRTLKNQELFDQKLAALEGREARAYHGVFSTHPDNDTRLKEIIAHARTLKAGGVRERDRFLNQVDDLVFGPNPAQGIIANGSFVHPDLGIAFGIPQGWLSQNQASEVLLADPSQQALMVVRMRSAGAGAGPEALLGKFGIGSLARAESLDADGLQGITGLATVRLGDATRPARVAAIIAGRYGYVFTGITRDPDALGRFDGTFRAVAASMRRPTGDDLAAARARRLAVTRLSGPVSWSALAQASPLERLAEDQLRLLNAAEGSGAAAGERIKVVE